MPKRAKELSALAVNKLKGDGRYAVGGVNGLYLRIVGDSRAWVLRVMVDCVRRDMGLGPYPEISLADAREAASNARRQVRAGVNPIEQRKTKREQAKLEAQKEKHTFAECAKAYIETQRAGWRSKKHAEQWSSTLSTYAYPFIGDEHVDEIDEDMVLKVLKQPVGDNSDKRPLWEVKTETATRVRGRIESVLDWAKFRKYRSGENPARWRGNLDNELAPRNKVKEVQHHPALPHDRMGAFMHDLRKRNGVSISALEFSILTNTRNTEVCEATWNEFDIPKRRWTIPARRMKNKREHCVPLSNRALTLIRNLPRVEGFNYVFPGSKGGKLSNAALGAVVDGMHEADLKSGGIGYLDPKQGKIATPHGIARSTFKDWCRSCKGTDYADEVSELALAHVNSDETRAAYARDKLFSLRAKLARDWSTFCSSYKPRS